MPRKRAPTYSVPDPETAELFLRGLSRGEEHGPSLFQIENKEARLAHITSTLRKVLSRSGAKNGAKIRSLLGFLPDPTDELIRHKAIEYHKFHEHLLAMGPKGAIDYAIALFGREKVRHALESDDIEDHHPAEWSPQQFKVWISVEVRRSVKGESVREACNSIARTRTYLRCHRLTEARTIERQYRRVNTAIRKRSELGPSCTWSVNLQLALWQKSKRQFEKWERACLTKF